MKWPVSLSLSLWVVHFAADDVIVNDLNSTWLLQSKVRTNQEVKGVGLILYAFFPF